MTQKQLSLRRMDFLNFLFPERLLRGSPWEREWHEQNHATLIRSTRYGCLSVGIIWLLHYPFFDVPAAGGPTWFWLKIRLIFFAASMFATALTFWPKLVQSKYFIILPIVLGWSYCLIEARAMLWSDKVFLVYPFVFIFLVEIVLRLNVFWSLLFAGAVIATQWPVYLVTHSTNIFEVESMASLALLCIYFYRSNAKEDILSYLNVRMLNEAKRMVLVKELELTGAVQRLLLPQENDIRSADFNLGAKFVPAAQSAGDWWWIRQSGSTLRIILGDVTGHGAGPAMVTATMTSVARVLYEPTQPFGDFLIRLQENFSDFFKDSEYWMTVTAAEFNFEEMRLKAWFAGGPPVYCLEPNNNHTLVSAPSSPFGASTNKPAYQETILRSNDRVIFASDGIYEQLTEATGKPIAFRRVSKIFQMPSFGSDAYQAADAIINLIAKERGQLEQGDDLTLVIVDVKN
jgi:hypothetical protein